MPVGPSRATVGNRAYAKRPFKQTYLPAQADDKYQYSVPCPSCKVAVGAHCVGITGPDPGWWMPPHPLRTKAAKELLDSQENLS